MANKLDLTVAGYIIDEDRVLLIEHKKLGLWLPVGGHIDPNETPDQAMVREAKEEVGLDIKLLQIPIEIPVIKPVIKHTALPFYCNIHKVKDHDHYSKAHCYTCKFLYTIPCTKGQ